MSTASTHDVTRLLQAWGGGTTAASDELLPLIYDHLRRIAREYMRQERPDHTLQPTALVHEAYLRLTKGEAIPWQGRAHFYNLAARAMRRVLVNHAIARQRLKRGGVQQRISITHAEGIIPPGETEAGVDLVALDAALGSLAENFPRQAQVVEMRFFAGMETPDVAQTLQVSEKTVLRDWQFARLWLRRRLAQSLD